MSDKRKETGTVQIEVVGEAVCLDNAGLENDFELGIAYPLLAVVYGGYRVEYGEKLIWVENRYGEPKQVLRERFELTFHQKNVVDQFRVWNPERRITWDDTRRYRKHIEKKFDKMENKMEKYWAKFDQNL